MIWKIKEENKKELVSESTMCSYPTDNPDDEGIRYITWYTEEGIFCRKAGQTEGYEWTVPFKSKEQYDKVMGFINKFPSDWNFRFAAHENFWKDYLNGSIDEEAFMDFMAGTDNGVPDYSLVRGDSVYIDMDKIKWAEYLNPLGGRFYTAEEFHEQQMELVASNAVKLPKITDSYAVMYKKKHPEYNGERIFLFEGGSELYTADEIAKLMYDKYLQTSDFDREEWRKKTGYPSV